METTASDVYGQFQLAEDWAERPFYRNPREGGYKPGRFQGREYHVKQLKSFFAYGSGGTVLVSGHRGVGKTATVDRALIETLEAIKDENDERAANRRSLLETRVLDNLRSATADRFRPKELIVLKLDFGQIASVRSAPAGRPRRQAADLEPIASVRSAAPAGRARRQAAAPEPTAAGTTEIDPRQVLIEIITGLHEHLVDGRVLTRDEARDERRDVREWSELRALIKQLPPQSPLQQSSQQSPPQQSSQQSPPQQSSQLSPPQQSSQLSRKWSELSGRLRSYRSTLPRRLRSYRFTLSRRLGLYRLTALRERRRQAFWSQLAVLLEQAMIRAYHQTYREEVARGSSTELVRQRSRKLTLDLNKLVVGVILLVAAVLLVYFGLGRLAVPALAELRGYLALGVGALGAVATATFSSSLTTKSSDAIKLVYSRDSSLPSLKRDLEAVMELLDSRDSPKDFRVVVILDELDKLSDNAMLDRVIQNFKNLFTLNRCVFVFITDKSYYEHVEELQAAAASEKTYAAQHTFFTRKTFLPLADYWEIRGFLDGINLEVANQSREQQQLWEEAVRYLTFEARCHFFDLMTRLNELVDIREVSRPLLQLRHERVGMVELLRKSHFQRAVELVYGRTHYAGHLDDHLNNDLLAALYGVFPNGRPESLPARAGKAPAATSEAASRREEARRQLVRLLVRCGALTESRANGRVALAWSHRLVSDEPRPEMLELDQRREGLVDELEAMERRWRVLEEALR